MSSPVPALTCSACGRRFAWKPEYAGKTLKCKCGQAIKAPAAAPAPGSGAARQSAPAPAKKAAPAKQPAAAAPAAVSSGDEDDIADLFGSAQAQYEMAPPPTAPPPKRATVAAPAAVPGGGSPLGYAGTSRKQMVDSGAGNGLAITSLVLGIISVALFWFCIPWLPRFLGVLAITFGFRAMRQGGGGKAKAGMILGLVGIVATILFWIVISNAADRIGNAMQKNLDQLQKQAEEEQRKAQENQTTQPAGATRPGARQNR